MTYGARASDPNSPTSPPAQGSSTEVRIGLQPNLRLFISEAAQVFVAAPNHQTLHEQVHSPFLFFPFLNFFIFFSRYPLNSEAESLTVGTIDRASYQRVSMESLYC